jgi:hypothetical protein
VVTDWKDIIYLHTSQSGRTNRDAVRISVLAGIDMSISWRLQLLYWFTRFSCQRRSADVENWWCSFSNTKMKFELNLFENTVAN